MIQCVLDSSLSVVFHAEQLAILAEIGDADILCLVADGCFIAVFEHGGTREAVASVERVLEGDAECAVGSLLCTAFCLLTGRKQTCELHGTVLGIDSLCLFQALGFDVLTTNEEALHGADVGNLLALFHPTRKPCHHG